MNLEQRLTDVAVIGAAGKMGSGISLLLALEMALQKIANPQKIYSLYLVDITPASLEGLWKYIYTQTKDFAEKQIVTLREAFKTQTHLATNEEMIQTFIDTVLCLLRLNTEITSAKNSLLVFEATLEKESLKQEIFQKLKEVCIPEAFFFTNTSSIPIHCLDKEAGLDGRLVGYHFYNPPAVQKLLEIIPSSITQKPLVDLSLELAQRLKKKVIFANDIAGFIGNGHFIRDGLYGIETALSLVKEYGQPQSIYMVNKISQDLLVRPMGIFQLIDYVGIDVFQCIQSVMSHYLNDPSLKNEWIDLMVSKKVLGGQKFDGSQKDGFFQYNKNEIIGVYNFETGQYMSLQEDWKKSIDEKLGAYPKTWSAWKKISQATNVKEKLQNFFNDLKSSQTLGAKLALDYLEMTKQIGEHLVSSGVAKTAEDVNGVLIHGFYHLYGPIHNF
jgi:3-hydroxyacyl-CoA dehydrogenase